MTPTIWLASYPRSGSTWLRMLIANLSSTDTPADINALANGTTDDDEPAIGVHFVQVHDAYKQTPNSDPLLAGRDAAGVILIVRDPRDVAPSLAAHNSSSIDEAIAFMGYPDDATPTHLQLPPSPLRWSSHIASWLEQKDIPVHLIRYEDLLLDTVTSFRRSLQFAGCATGDDVIRRAVVYSKFEQLQKQERTRGFREAHLRAGHFFRRGVAGSWRSELTAAQVARIEADHSAMMQRLGYKLSTKVGPHTSSSASPTS
jgi:aryl sulfotransferase